jgi:hypothetical protein
MSLMDNRLVRSGEAKKIIYALVGYGTMAVYLVAVANKYSGMLCKISCNLFQ